MYDTNPTQTSCENVCGKRVARLSNPGKRSVMIGKIFSIIAMILMATTSIAVISSHAQSRMAPEYEIKAAFLYNFAKFIEWPDGTFADDTNATITLCVICQDSFCDILLSLRDKTVKNKKLVVKRCKQVQNLEECHILFIGSSESKKWRQILKAVENRNVLTIGEMEGFSEFGGMINFILVKNKVRFEINVDAAKRAGFKLSSKLLKLANIVSDERRTGMK